MAKPKHRRSAPVFGRSNTQALDASHFARDHTPVGRARRQRSPSDVRESLWPGRPHSGTFLAHWNTVGVRRLTAYSCRCRSLGGWSVGGYEAER